jgi:hypothetical protein
MANAKRDDNRKAVLLGVTDDANATVSRLLVDPATGRLKISATVSNTGGMITTPIGNASTVSSALTRYVDSIDINATETSVGNIIPLTGTLLNLYINVTANSLNSGTVVFTIMKNGSATSVTKTVNAGVTGIVSDTTNTASITAGDRITLRIVTSGSSGSVTSCFSYFIQ